MPFRKTAYHDPNIAQGFSSIAGVFAPPNGADMYGFAKAGQTRVDMQRKAAALDNIRAGKASIADYIDAGVANPARSYGIADMYNSASTPGTTPDSLDARS
jgi:hypothetical protein